MTTSVRLRAVWSAHVVKLIRYSAVSVGCTAFTFVGLALLVGVLNLPAAWANFTIVAVAIPPAFEVSRRWVWSRSDGSWMSPEIIPFAGFALAGLALSTLNVHVVGQAVAHWSPWTRTLAVEGASFSAFTLLWLAEFVVLDRFTFSGPDA